MMPLWARLWLAVGLNRWPVRYRVVVNCDDGHAFDAVLWAKSGPLLILRDAQMYAPGAEPVPVDGAVMVERRRVSFIQVRGV